MMIAIHHERSLLFCHTQKQMKNAKEVSQGYNNKQVWKSNGQNHLFYI